MNLEHYIQILKEHVCSDGASVLAMLYMCYNDSNTMDDEKHKNGLG